MSYLKCKLCQLPSREAGRLRKHMKSEHSVVSYKVDLVLALSLLSVKEESLLISRTKPRFTKFQDSGFLDTNDNLFGGEGGREVNNDDDATESELTEIQMRILADLSDDDDEDEEYDETLLDKKDAPNKSEVEMKVREDALLLKLINDQIKEVKRVKKEEDDGGGGVA